MGSHSKALVVDDEATNRLLLRSILSKSNFDVIEAENGVQALELFQNENPDIVFMDAMMPVMDGFEATTAIKALCGDYFVPVIFLTALTDKDSLARCIEAGGDDFLTKPISSTLLRAKIRALERIRDLQHEVRSLYDHMRHDEEIGQKIFDQLVQGHGYGIEKIRHHLVPASLFSGDMLLMEKSPSGDLNILLADFTGHGLSAALCAMPAADAFRELTKKGFAPEQILSHINAKLYSTLPRGMFMALQFVSLNVNIDRILVANCGMPDIYIVDGETRAIKKTIKSGGLPLGVVKSFDMSEAIQYLSLSIGDRIILASDGVTEAEGPAGDFYGEDRYLEAITSSADRAFVVDSVVDSVREFCQEEAQRDDVSIVEIPFSQELIDLTGLERDAVNARAGDKRTEAEQDIYSFELNMRFSGKMLSTSDPVPMFIGQVREVVELGDERAALYTVMTEMYLNALDHGVLKMDSALKDSAEGFASYYEEREKLLQELDSGYIEILVKVGQSEQFTSIAMRVEDSGGGFDVGMVSPDIKADDGLSRRGIPLLYELCDSVQYNESGNVVEAVYRWAPEG